MDVFSRRVRGAAVTLCLCAAALGLSPFPSGTAATPEGPAVRTAATGASPERERSWVLRDIPADDRTLHGGNAKFDTHFDLGAAARQREGEWYTVRFRVRIRVTRTTLSREPATVAATVNGLSGAMISLTPANDSVRVFYNGALGGPTARYEKGEYFTVDYENYTQDHAIKSGNNRFSVELTQEGTLVKEVIVDPVTGITRTDKALQQLSVQVTSPIRAQEGKTIALQYSVTRRGQRPDRPATVRAQVMSGQGARIHEGEHRYPSIGAGRRGQFEMIAKRGQHLVQVVLRGGYNPAAQFVIVDVRLAEPSAAGRAAPLLAAGALALLGVASLVRPRARVKRWLASRRES